MEVIAIFIKLAKRIILSCRKSDRMRKHKKEFYEYTSSTAYKNFIMNNEACTVKDSIQGEIKIHFDLEQ